MSCEACAGDCSQPIWCTEQIKWICPACYTAKHGGPPPAVDDSVAHPKVITSVTDIPGLDPDHAVHSILMSLEQIFRFNADDISVNLKKLDITILQSLHTLMCEKLQGKVEALKDLVPKQRRAVNTAVGDIIILGHSIISSSLVKGINSVFPGSEPDASEAQPDFAEILVEFQALKTEFESLKSRIVVLEAENASLKSKQNSTPDATAAVNAENNADSDVTEDVLAQSEDTPNSTTFKVNFNCEPSEDFSHEFIDITRQRKAANRRPMGPSDIPQAAPNQQRSQQPASYKMLFIGNLSKQCSVKNLVNHLKSMDISPGRISCLTSNEAGHKSYKVEIPAAQMNTAMAPGNWVDGIRVRPFREPAQGGAVRPSQQSPAQSAAHKPYHHRPRSHASSNHHRGQQFRQNQHKPRSNGTWHQRRQYQQQPLQQQQFQQQQQQPIIFCQPSSGHPAWNGWPPLPARPFTGHGQQWQSSPHGSYYQGF